MDASTTRERLLERALDIDDEQFEHLCKIVLEWAEQTQDLELTPFRADGGIDVHAVIDRDLFHARLGVQAKQYAPNRTVGVRALREFKSALREQDYHIGTIITTGSYTNGAIESAELEYIRLIDGETLTRILLEGNIGVTHAEQEGYQIDQEFWGVFEGPEDTAMIPSLEVPQADNFDIIDATLEAVDQGLDTKPELTSYYEHVTGESWDPRQADYYGIACWQMGFLHKHQRIELERGTARRWGLTRRGERYLHYLNSGQTTKADELLYKGIREIAIIRRVLDSLEKSSMITREDIVDIIDTETAVGGTTQPRRANSVGTYLTKLPEIRVDGRGLSQTYELTTE